MRIRFERITGTGEGLNIPNSEVLSLLAGANLDGRLFIDGEFVKPLSTEVIVDRSPINSEQIGEFADAGESDVADAVGSARRAFTSGSWSRAGLQTRKRVLLKLAAKIEEKAELFAALDSLDVGKPYSMALGVDVPAAVTTFRWYAELVDKVYSSVAPTDNLDLLIREPFGVVGAVVPWNYPLMITAWKVAPMLAAGNSVVLKPAEQSPLSALLLAVTASEAGLPKGVLNVVTGNGPSAGRALGLSPDVDAIGFTGSTEVGKKFLEYSGQSNMKSVTLECGGKSPMIVFGDANPKLAAEAMASAVFYNAGQSCNAPARALLHESIEADFIRELSSLTHQYMPDNALNKETRVGAIVDGEQLRRIVGFVSRAQSDGAKLVCGGTAAKERSGGFYMEPTILSNTSQDMEVNREEIFGPVVPVQTFRSDEEAVALANDIDYGLWANVWTNDMSRTLHLARAIHAGTVAFNTVWGGGITTPMGGYKRSGLGRDRGVEGMLKYMQLKHVSMLPLRQK